MSQTYKIVSDSSGLFSFTTDYNVKYTLYILEANPPEMSGYPSLNCYTFGFDKDETVNGQYLKKVYDPKIERTIISFLDSSIKDENAILFFTYSNIEYSDRARKILFQRWFKKSTKAVNYQKIDIQDGLLASILVHKNHPYRQFLLSRKDVIMNDINEAKS